MISGVVPFEEIVQSIQDETGITNIFNYLERLRRLIFRAERDIGYGGSVVLKRCKYTINVNFNGTFIPLPEDLIELEGIGRCPEGTIYHTNYNVTQHGIRFRSIQTEVVLLYWTLACDGYGNPVVTRNHEEAVVAYCVWKLYMTRRFSDKGNANTANDYKNEYRDLLGYAINNDAFPTLDEWNELALLSYADRRGLLQLPTAIYSFCDELIPACCSEDNSEEPVKTQNMYYWQFNDLNLDISYVTENMPEFLDNEIVEQLPLEAFENGYTVNYQSIGRIGFIIKDTSSQNWEIRDFLNNNVTEIFDYVYDAELSAMIFCSKKVYTYSNIYFKFKNNG